MAYQSLYRKFRPKTFDELLGQSHVTTTLKNQIINDNIAHAYLFSGTRGTGKTSAAKIFARTVNCLNNDDGNPCNECEVCKGILEDSVMDVVEMDAASNNSVEDIRDLREKAKYPPSKGRYKVYIVDEVHMLSKGAFNALLKTLEEPPSHLLFILATTEPQKLPTTIQSRCQRFDFKRINVNDIINNMQTICKQLNIDVEERGLHLIARNADGAMRDALSILDQCVSSAEDNITYDHILAILGTVNNTTIFEISNGIIEKDTNVSLKEVDKIVQSGKDINQFIKDLILHFRNLMIVKSTENVENIVEGSDEFIKDLKEQSKGISLSNIIRCINILSEAENQSKWSSQPRIVLEISVIKLCNNTASTSVEGLLSRIEELEGMIKSGKILIKEKDINNNIDIRDNPDNEYKVNKDNTKSNNSNTYTSDNKSEMTTPQHTEEKHSFDNENINITQIKKKWAEVLKTIKKDRISIHALIMEGKPLQLNGKTLIISFDEGFGFHRDAIDKQQNKEYIQEILNNFFKANLNVRFVMDSEVSNVQNQEKKTDKLVEQVKNVFGDDLVEVE